MAAPQMRSVQGAPVTPAEFHILLALADRDRHGYALMQQIAADSQRAVALGPGTLYGAIRRLLETGYIREAESQVDPDLDDARRRYYRLTPAGRAAAAAEAGRLEHLVGLAYARDLMAAPARARGGRR